MDFALKSIIECRRNILLLLSGSAITDVIDGLALTKCVFVKLIKTIALERFLNN